METYRYFATDPVTGYEHYTQNAGLSSATGTFGALSNGTRPGGGLVGDRQQPEHPGHRQPVGAAASVLLIDPHGAT